MCHTQYITPILTIVFSPSRSSNLKLIIAVIAVSNGLQAWKILEDFSNHIDLVLTEVVMPFLSGIGLLCKITSHKTFKNIPVISKYQLVVILQ